MVNLSPDDSQNLADRLTEFALKVSKVGPGSAQQQRAADQPGTVHA